MSEHDTNEAAEAVQYDPSSSKYDILECPECDNVVLALGRDDPPMSCHGEQMQRVIDCDITVKPPDVRQVLLDAFGLPKAGLDICLCVIRGGPLFANEDR